MSKQTIKLISADRVCECLQDWIYTLQDILDGYGQDDVIWCKGFNKGIHKAISVIRKLQTDGTVKRAHWIKHVGLCECSNCHSLYGERTPYCPRCGARMNEREDANEAD